MSRPAFQFYPKDWRNNANLRRCSEAARGAWVDVLCLLHDSDEYGVLRWTLAEIARAAGVPLRLLKELATKGVFKGADKNATDYEWAPTHAGRQGEPVTLVTAGDGPCWYCSRFVRDEEIRRRRGQGTRFGDEDAGAGKLPKDQPNKTPNEPPKPTFGGESGDGLAFASASASASSSVGSSSASEEISPGGDPSDARSNGVLVTDGDGVPVVSPIVTLTQAQSAQVVKACLALRKMGALRFHPGDEFLIALAAEGFNAEQVVRCLGQKALRDAGLWDDPDTNPELFELLINGASQQAMGLTPTQYAAVRSAAAQVSGAYIAGALRGRRRDALRASEDAPGVRPAARGKKPSATDNFEGKTYVGTAIDQLPSELRAALESEQSGG